MDMRVWTVFVLINFLVISGAYARVQPIENSCQSDADCNDNNICTLDRCIGTRIFSWTFFKKCVNTAIPNCPPTPNLTCTDSDNGLNYYVKGTTRNNSANETDSCRCAGIECPINQTTPDCGIRCFVQEYYCKRHQIMNDIYLCPGTCQNGACISKPSNATCTDSDGGLNYYTKGVGTGIYAGSDPNNHMIYGQEPDPLVPKPSPYNYSIFYDHCAFSAQINEAHCIADGRLSANGFQCPYGCSNGACILNNTQPCPMPMPPYCPNGTLISGGTNPTTGCPLPSTCCGDGTCSGKETITNCAKDCSLPCKKEGESVPVIASPPSCCSGLTLIKPKISGIVGSYGICTAKCGNGACDSVTESTYNCPADCKVIVEPPKPECTVANECSWLMCTWSTTQKCVSNKCQCVISYTDRNERR